jgi:hypothetical protein
VLERDVRQHLDRGTQDIRCVVAAAEAGLHDRHVDAGGGELRQRGRRQELELRRLEALGRLADAVDGGVEVGFAVLDPDALAPAADVRGEVGADSEPFLRQQRLCRARDRRLPIGADDVDRRIAELRIAQRAEERLDAVEPEAVLRPGAQRLDVLKG